MPHYLTLDETKDQLAIHRSDTRHDERLTRLIGAAVTWAENRTNVTPLDELAGESPSESPLEVPEDVKQALLLHVEAHFDRDPAQFQALLDAAHELLWPYREGLEI